jgi:hypothetical protein
MLKVLVYIVEYLPSVHVRGYVISYIIIECCSHKYYHVSKSTICKLRVNASSGGGGGQGEASPRSPLSSPPKNLTLILFKQRIRNHNKLDQTTITSCLSRFYTPETIWRNQKFF